MALCTELEQIIQRFVLKHKRPQTVTAISRKTNEGEAPPDLISNYTAELQ